MKVCELIEWLKREDQLMDVEIEILDPNYPCITTFASGIKEIIFLGDYMKKVRIIGSKMAVLKPMERPDATVQTRRP